MLNVLIAVVVDSYGAVKDEDSEEVFWSSRLEFATEVVVIFERHMPKNNDTCCGCCSNIWDFFMSAFQDKRSRKLEGSKEFSSFYISDRE